MRRQFVQTMECLMSCDERLVLLLGDIGVHGFSRVASLNRDRVVNIGILEQTMVGVASGMAKVGLIPTIHSIAPFIVERALEQIKIDFGYQKLGGNLVTVGASYDYSALGSTHHCPGDVSALLTIPGVSVYVPGSAKDFDGLFRAVYDNGKTNYFRLSERSNSKDLDYIDDPSKVHLLKHGTNSLLLALGPSVEMALSASVGLGIGVAFTASVNPLDCEGLAALMSNYKNLIVIEPFYEGSTLPIIQPFANKLGFRVECFGMKREFLRSYGTRHDLDLESGFNHSCLNERLRNINHGIRT
jgi:transketolase